MSKRTRSALVISPTAALLSLLLLIGLASQSTAASAPPARGLQTAIFFPLPKTARVAFSIMFKAASKTELDAEHLTPRAAVKDLVGQFTLPRRARVSEVSFGSYINELDIVHDWIGTKSKYPTPRSVYMITVRGLQLSSLGGARTVNHEETIIDNAVTGRIIGSFPLTGTSLGQIRATPRKFDLELAFTVLPKPVEPSARET